MIVFTTPKGWTGPREVDGVPIEGTFRAHQVPLAGLEKNPKHLALLETWMKSAIDPRISSTPAAASSPSSRSSPLAASGG